MLGNAPTIQVEEEGATPLLSPSELAHERRVERGRKKQLTLDNIREEFREWLLEQHGKVHSELRRKRDEQRLAAPIVAAVRHLERCRDIATEYNALCAQIGELEARYSSLDAAQKVALDGYEVDFSDANTVLLFHEFTTVWGIEKWWDLRE